MASFETTQQNLTNSFQQKRTLRPKTILLRKISQEKHVKRMKEAYKMKQIVNQSGSFTNRSPPMRKASYLKSSFTNIITEREGNSSKPNALQAERRLSKLSGHINTKGTFVEETVAMNEKHPKNKKNEKSDEEIVTLVSLLENTNITAKNYDSEVESISFVDESGEHLSKIALEDKIHNTTNESSSYPSCETRVITSPTVLNKTFDNNDSDDFSYGSEESLFRTLKSDSSCLTAKSLSEEDFNFDTKKQTATPVTNENKKAKKSKIPLSVERIALMKANNSGKRTPYFTTYLKTEDNSKAEFCSLRINGTKSVQSMPMMNYVKNNSTNSILGTCKTSDNCMQSKHAFFKSTTKSQEVENKTSSVLSWLNGLSVGSQKKTESSSEKIGTNDSIKAKSKLSLKGLKIGLKFAEHKESGGGWKHSKEADGSQNHSQIKTGLKVANRSNENRDNEIPKRNNKSNWNDSDDESIYLSNESFEARYDNPSKNKVTSNASLPFLDKPLRYSKPYNLRYPRYRLDKSKSMLGVDEKLIDGSLNMHSTPYNLRFPRMGESRSMLGIDESIIYKSLNGNKTPKSKKKPVRKPVKRKKGIRSAKSNKQKKCGAKRK